MMKHYLLALGIIFTFTFQALAQDPVCLPDSSYQDSLAGVYPGPYHPELFPDGGIHDTACIDHPFELTLTAVVSDSIEFGGLQLVLNYLQIEEDGILNMPEGLDYACNPPNCKFESNTIGCMIISGTPLDINPVGTYDLQLKSEIVALNGLITINDTLPEFLIPGSHYYLELEGSDSDNCQELSTHELALQDLHFNILKNPSEGSIPLEFTLGQGKAYRLELIDMNGRRIESLEGKGNGYTRLVLNTSYGNEHTNASMGNLSVVIVRLITPDGMISRKVVLN